MEPGQMIRPDGSNEVRPNSAPDHEVVIAVTRDAAPQAQPQQEVQPQVQPQSPPQPRPIVEQPEAVVLPAPTPPEQSIQPSWSFNNDAVSPNAGLSPDTTAQSTGSVQWTASEYILHEKSPAWYGILIGGGVLFAAIIYLLTKDVITIVTLLFVFFAFLYYALRRPRTLQYVIDEHGIVIGNKAYDFHDFKAFSVIEEGAIASIILLPLKRFMPAMSVYYPPEQEDEILGALNTYLPYEQHTPDAIERLMMRIRF